MKPSEQFSKDEASLLLYLGACAVNKSGRVNSDHMTDDDFQLAEKWAEHGFIRFGRIAARYCGGSGSHWVEFTDEAWKIAGELRKARGIRMFASKPYKTTDEERDEQ